MAAYLNGTKREMALALYERGQGISELGRLVVLNNGQRVAVLNREVPSHIRDELFHGLDLDKIINEEPSDKE